MGAPPPPPLGRAAATARDAGATAAPPGDPHRPAARDGGRGAGARETDWRVEPTAPPQRRPPHQATAPSSNAADEVVGILRRLLHQARDPDDDGLGEGLPQGARGFAAREKIQSELSTRPAVFTDSFRRLLARETETDLSRLEPAALRGFFERRVHFGTHRLLAHTGHLLAHLWELAERQRPEELQAAIATGAAFVEQAALDNGRLEVAWQLTGLTAPSSTAARAPQQLQRPGASLFPPRWMAANIAYLRDLDYLASRTSAALGTKPPPQQPPKAAEATGGATAQATPRRGGRGGSHGRGRDQGGENAAAA